jgi:hypothetical protein
MIFQRLNTDHSLAAAVEHLRSGELDDVLLSGGSLPARTRRISGSTGGFCRARERLALPLIESAVDGINSALEETHTKNSYEGLQVFVIDGSTIRVPYTPENIEQYPQYENQFGKAHFPLLRVGVATNAITGIAIRPAYGPYNGEHAIGELTLAEELFARLPSGAVVIGDRYFGCSRFAAMAQRSGLYAVTRVKETNAKRFIGNPTSATGEVFVTWKSKQSRTGESYSVAGRFIWHTVKRKGFRPKQLVLFTTLTVPLRQVVALYKLRWNVELDLRDLKSTLGMDMLYSKTPAMCEKEIVLGVAAYNLVRHLMLAAAKQLKVLPRALSFSRVLKRLHATTSALESAPTDSRIDAAMRSFHSHMRSLLLPQRRTPRPQEPRKVWQKGHTTFMTNSRSFERNALNNPHPSKMLRVK